jgi:O-antigen ligase
LNEGGNSSSLQSIPARKIGLLRGLVDLSLLIRSAPFGLVLLAVGLSFPIGPEVGPVTVTLVDLTIVCLAMLLGMDVAVRNRRLRVPLLGAWTVFLFGAYGSTLLSRDMGQSIIFFIEKVEMFLIFYLILNLVRRQEQVMGLLLVFVLCSILNAVLGLSQFFGLTELGLQGRAVLSGMWRARPAGFIGGSFGAFLGTAIVLVVNWLLVYWRQWSRSVRWLCLASLLVLMFGLIATLARTWIFSMLLALSLVTLQLSWRAKLRVIFVAVVALAVLLLALNYHWFDLAGEGMTEFARRRLFGLAEQSYFRTLEYGRYGKWARAWNDFLAAPILGVGMGVERFPDPSGRVGLVDNFYLELLSEMGLVGTLGFLLIATSALLRTWKTVRLTRGDPRLGTPLGLLGGQVLWLLGGVLWTLFGSGKPGMMFIWLIALAVAYQLVLVKEVRYRMSA